MATIRQELQAKLDALTAAYEAEKAPIEAELAAASSWLDKEWHELEAWITHLRNTAAPTPPTPPAAP